MKKVLFKIIIPLIVLGVWALTCYLVVLIISFIGFWSAVLMASEKCVCFLCQRILGLPEA